MTLYKYYKMTFLVEYYFMFYLFIKKEVVLNSIDLLVNLIIDITL